MGSICVLIMPLHPKQVTLKKANLVQRKNEWLFELYEVCKRKVYLPVSLASLVTAKRNKTAKMNMHFMFMTEDYPCSRNYFSKIYKLEIFGRFHYHLILYHLCYIWSMVIMERSKYLP